MSLTQAFIQKHIEDWERQLTGPSHPYRAKWPHFLFHHSPIQNAALIFKDGYLRSRNDPLNDQQYDVAAQDVLNTRSDAHNRVRLYFRPGTPTQYHIEGVRKGGECHFGETTHCPTIAMLVLSAGSVLALPDVLISDRNMQRGDRLVGNTEDFFTTIPFSKVYHVGPIGGDHSIIWHRCAEVLPTSPLSLKQHLKGILFRSKPEMEMFLHLLGDRRLEAASLCRVSDDLKVFEKRFSFVKLVELRPDGLVFCLHPRVDGQPVNVKINAWTDRGIKVIDQQYSSLADKPTGAALWITKNTLASGTYRVRIDIEGHTAYEGMHLLGDHVF